MVIGIGLVKDRFHQVIGTHYPKTGVEHSRLWFIEGYSAGLTVGVEHWYNGVRVPGPTLMQPGQTFRADVYGDIAYYRVVFREQGGLHCSWVICTKEYDIEGREWNAYWKQVDSDIHDVTVVGKEKCDHASSWRQKGLVTRKP